MYSSFRLASKYLHYYRHASNSKGHGMHSPFVFDFILNVLNNKSNYDPPSEIERLRSQLLRDKRMIEIQEMGAGSRTSSSNQRAVNEIAKSALKSKRLARVLYRLAKHYQPKNVIELGTSLGITTAYLSKAIPAGEIITIEGNASTAAIATQNFQRLSCTNIKLIHGNFDTVLPSVLDQLSVIDLAYIDGNHRYQPTINYFHQLLSKSGSDTILVFDDIHWSVEMEKAWEEIKAHPSVQYTIDIFFLGFVFFRQEFKVKQDFAIRF
ncbi:MAG: O-methyltransferase [Flavisolibacter sp.]